MGGMGRGLGRGRAPWEGGAAWLLMLLLVSGFTMRLHAESGLKVAALAVYVVARVALPSFPSLSESQLVPNTCDSWQAGARRLKAAAGVLCAPNGPSRLPASGEPLHRSPCAPTPTGWPYWCFHSQAGCTCR